MSLFQPKKAAKKASVEVQPDEVDVVAAPVTAPEEEFISNLPAPASIDEGFERIEVHSPFWINGVQYGPGVCDVPVGTFSIYKTVLVKG